MKKYSSQQKKELEIENVRSTTSQQKKEFDNENVRSTTLT